MAQTQRSSFRRSMGALACATATVFAAPDHDLWWLSFVAWIPYLYAIEGLAPARAFLFGWLAGTVTVYWGFSWMNELLTRFADFPMAAAAPVTLLFAGWQGLQWALPAAAVAWLRRRTGRDPGLALPLAWTAVEALLPNIFPVYLALLWAWHPLWIQTAEIGGVSTVSFLMLAINTSVYRLSTAALERRFDRTAALASLLLAIGIPSYGALRIAAVQAKVESMPHVRFAIVQGNMSIEQMSSGRWRKQILAGHQRKTAELEAQGAQLAVWGETAYPNGRIFGRETKTDLPEGHPWRVRAGFSIPLIFGAITSQLGDELRHPWNSALALDANDRIVDVYDKVYLLAFGEYVPVVDPEWFLELVPSAAHLNRGAGPDTLHVDGYELGPLICYEDILPRYARDVARRGIHAFVNLTNDSWFGKTHEPAQHLGLAVFRTVENRRAMVRAVNTGISAYIDPTGRVHHRTLLTDPEVDGPVPPDGFVADVPMIAPDAMITPYRATGESFHGIVCIAFLLLARRRRVVTTGSA